MKNELQLINTLLCESRIFRSKQDIAKYSDTHKRDLYYAILLSTIALALDTKTKQWARQYASAAAAFSNFDYFRIAGNDLYLLTYILQTEMGIISKSQKMQILRLYKGIGRGNVDRSFVQQMLLRMERSLRITDGRLRQARRAITNWAAASVNERKAAITQLHRFIRSRAKLAEVLPYLMILTKGEKGRYGKPSALKTVAAIAGAGLAGLALGLRYDPNKRFKITNDINREELPITEARPTQLLQLVYDMKKHPGVEKVISVHYLVDGISAFVRTTDGNAYEMEIRPANYAKGHEEKRGVTEGWEWMLLGENEDDPECWDCYDTGWTTEQHWEEEVNVPCSCEKSGEFRDRFVQEDVWQWISTEISTDVLNEDTDTDTDTDDKDNLCPTCDGLGKEFVGDEQLVFDCPDCKGVGSI